MNDRSQGGVDLGDKQKKPHTLDIAAAIKGVPNITHKKGLEYFFWGRLTQDFTEWMSRRDL
jgi:hypothetical protein